MPRTPEARLVGQRPLIAGVAALVLASGLVQVMGDDAGTGAPQDVVATDGGAAAAEPGRTSEVVGPPRGGSIAEYIADRQLSMASAPAEVDTAIVSFVALQSTTAAAALVGPELEVRAVLLRLPLVGAAPMTVLAGDDAAAAVSTMLAQAIAPLADEEAQTRELIDSGSVSDEAFLADYERRVEELSSARAAATGDAVLVHAVVVRGPLAAIQALEGVAEIRLVDPAPPNTDVPTSVFHGLLPSDEDVASFGRLG